MSWVMMLFVYAETVCSRTWDLPCWRLGCPSLWWSKAHPGGGHQWGTATPNLADNSGAGPPCSQEPDHAAPCKPASVPSSWPSAPLAAGGVPAIPALCVPNLHVWVTMHAAMFWDHRSLPVVDHGSPTSKEMRKSGARWQRHARPVNMHLGTGSGLWGQYSWSGGRQTCRLSWCDLPWSPLCQAQPPGPTPWSMVLWPHYWLPPQGCAPWTAVSVSQQRLSISVLLSFSLRKWFLIQMRMSQTHSCTLSTAPSTWACTGLTRTNNCESSAQKSWSRPWLRMRLPKWSGVHGE